MDLLIDECVTESVVQIFRSRKHHILYVAKELGQSTPDRLVAETANENNLILVTWNARHFRNLGASRRPPNNRQEFRNLGMISFVCDEDQGARRAAQVMRTIEFEYSEALTRPDKRLLITIKLDQIVIYY
jgi:hypothetical protein